jgi:hypothetical protein
MVTKRDIFESPDITPLHCFVGLNEERKLQKNEDTGGELLACTVGPATRIKKREDQVRRKTRDIRTRVEKCMVVDGGIFENLL